MENRVSELAENIRRLAKLYKGGNGNRSIRAHLENTAVAVERLLVVNHDNFNEKQVKKRLGSIGVKSDSISYVHMHDGRGRIGLYAYTKSGCIKTQKMAEVIGETLGLSVVPARDERSIVAPKRMYFVLYEQTAYTVLQGSAVLSKNKGEVSGDSFTMETVEDGRAVMAIADGMGTGTPAAGKSMMVIDFVERLFENGFEAEAIPDMINSAIIETEADNPVTMDLATVDLNNGMGRIVKMGGAASYILRKGIVMILRPSSLPAGVLADVEADVWEEQFEDGVYVFMVSDGVVDCLPFYDKESKLGEIIEIMKCRNPQNMAEHILSECRYFCGDENGDDMTVLVMGVWKTKGLQRF